jgi:hypothetical protein
MGDAVSADSEALTFHYRIAFQDHSKTTITARINREDLSLISEPGPDPPKWTRLGFRKCPICPLDEATHAHCPVAVNLVDIITAFKDRQSFEEVDVVVESDNRTYSKHTTLQAAISSLLGLYMPTSGCPFLDKLRPMVDMHLPFQSRQETVYRLISSYLVTQHILHKDGREVEWDLGPLVKHLEQIRRVNAAFCRRLNAVAARDASVNALVILSTLGDVPNRPLTQRALERLQNIVRNHYA